MDFFNGVDLGAYASFRFNANRLPALVSVLLIVRWIGLLGWIPLLASVAVMWTNRHLRLRANVMLAVALVGLTSMEAVRWSANRPRPEDAEILLGPQVGKSFPNVPAFAFPLAGIVAMTAWMAWRKGRGIRTSPAMIVGAFGAIAGLSALIAFAELFLGLAFVSDVITGLAGGVGFGLLARFAGVWAGGETSPRGATIPPSTAIRSP